MRHHLAVLVVLATAALATPASAADFSVSTGPELTAALGTAAGNGTADRILLAAGTYTGPFTYNGTGDLEVLGAGAGTTTIDQISGNAGLFLQNATATYHVADVGFTLAATAARGLVIAGAGTVERVQVTAASGFNGQALWVQHGGVTVQHVALSQTGAPSASLLQVSATGAVLVQDSTFSGGGAEIFTQTSAATITAVRDRFTGPFSQGIGANPGTVTVSDSVFEMGAAQSAALVAGDSNNSAGAATSSIDASRITIVATGSSNQRGAQASPNSVGDDFSVALHDSVLVGLSSPLQCSTSGAGVTGAITTDYSSVPAAGNFSNCTPGISQTHPVTNSGLGFADLAGGDYRLLFSSPLVDAGNPALLAPTFDFAGASRPVDGNGDGTATRDVGALEYQRTPPAVSAAGAPSAPAIGQSVDFSATATDADPGNEAITLSWAFDDGAVATGAQVSHAFATAGAHTGTVTATDVTGAKGTAIATVTIAAPADAGGGSGGAGGGGGAGGAGGAGGGDGGGAGGVTPDRTAPVTTAFSVRRGVARFTLSEAAATVRITLVRRSHGKYRHVKGAFAVTGAAGANVRRLAAKRFAALRPGRYRAALVARDAAGNVSRRVVATFRVRRAG